MIYTVTFNPAIDYVVRLDAPLEVGEVNRAKGEDCVLGGKGINVSGVLAQLGCESVALGFVAGETGAWLERGLAAQGLKTDFVHLEQGMTRINVKIKAGQETELNGAGPDIPESAMQELEKKLDSLNEDDILILAGSIPASLSQDTYERLLARLQGRGVRAVVDATRDLLVNVLQYHPFLIKPNEYEIGLCAGRPVEGLADVKQAALELGLPVIESDPSEETFVSELAATGAQAAAVVAYGKILKQDVLDALPMGWYNLHFSLLPQWRGAAPVQRSIWAGEKVTGATVFRIVRAMDAGPILAQSTVEIGAHETAGELLGRLAEDGSHLLAASLQALADDQIAPVEQPAGAYEVAQKITVEDAHIRFDVPVFAADRQIRACTPNPGAWCELHAHADAEPATLHVLRAQPADISNPNAPASLEPGHIVAGKKNVWVGTSTEPLELLEVKAQGKKAMRAADWARGAHLGNAFCEWGFCHDSLH